MEGAEPGRRSGDMPIPRGPYSLYVARESLVFVSGLLAVKGNGEEVTGDVREETMVVLRNLGQVLRQAGSGLDRVLMVTVFLRDIGELAAFNEVYEEFFRPPFPARCVAGVELPGGFRVEVSAVASR